MSSFPRILSGDELSTELVTHQAVSRFRDIIDILGMAWYLCGNWWVLSSQTCQDTCPAVYYTGFIAVIVNFFILSCPLVVFAFVFCLLPRLFPTVARLNGQQVGAAQGRIDKLELGSFLEADVQEGGCCSCAICLVDYAEKDELRRLPCRHGFHRHCVDQWLRINKCCPLCMQDIDGIRTSSI